ncbi:hypothetical protein GQ55_7G118800 [Panicum hallii var. hallii]|uniref:Uncharacterized protein n=1 Tax=Panicum hallii var. hallii TaxID=1504633 RepID=A0A2T7CU63_9POAL|nr:hypothetical protein GQ55_7G118800 [Panicum hallii var. hallii]
MSLKIILCEAMNKLNYHWYESGTPHTREGLHQTSIEVQSTSFHAVKPIFTIYGKALPRRCEAKESALILTLFFIDESLGYKIGDVHYVKYLLLANNIR